MKKLFAILGMITCMAGLCACGGEEKAAPANEESMVQFGEQIVEQMDMVVSQGTVENYAGQPALYAGLKGWESALDDIGTFDRTEGGTAEATDDGMAIRINVIGSSHNATVEIVLDGSTGDFAGITTNVDYSLGEIMEKAGMNTLIGMGTVFVILILISLIISSFTLISKIEENKRRKADAAAASSSAAQPAPAIAPAAEEELADDTELVAVIAAAVAAYEGSGSTDGFVVRSIRKSNKSKWQNA